MNYVAWWTGVVTLCDIPEHNPGSGSVCVQCVTCCGVSTDPWTQPWEWVRLCTICDVLWRVHRSLNTTLGVRPFVYNVWRVVACPQIPEHNPRTGLQQDLRHSPGHCDGLHYQHLPPDNAQAQGGLCRTQLQQRRHIRCLRSAPGETAHWWPRRWAWIILSTISGNF